MIGYKHKTYVIRVNSVQYAEYSTLGEKIKPNYASHWHRQLHTHIIIKQLLFLRTLHNKVDLKILSCNRLTVKLFNAKLQILFAQNSHKHYWLLKQDQLKKIWVYHKPGIFISLIDILLYFILSQLIANTLHAYRCVSCVMSLCISETKDQMRRYDIV